MVDKKGQQIRAGASPPPFSGNAQKKTFFFQEGFPKCCCCFAMRMKMCVEALGSFDISLKRRHKKALAESLTEMKRKSIKDAKTEDRRVDAIR